MAAPKGNIFALGNAGGRPPVFASPDELAEKVVDYFQMCKDDNVKTTITGLALYLGFDSRQSLYDYENKQEFSYIIKRSKLAVENGYELSGTAFDIFALKNMGWKDKVEQEQYGKDGGPIQNETKHTVEFHDYSKNGYQTKV